MDTQLGAKTVVLGTNGAAPSAELPLVSPIFTSATQAADAFSRSIVAHDIAGAFSVLSARDRLKVGDPVHFELLLSDNAAWRSAKTSSVDASNIAQFDVTQDPALDEVRGDVASLATVRLPMVNETAGWKVAWSKRSIEQHYLSTDEPAGGANNTTNATTGTAGTAGTTQISAATKAWITTRASCQTDRAQEAPNGLLGVVGLAQSLCGAKGAAEIGTIDTLDTMNDPQPVLDAFGSAAANWSRVVNITGPIRMQAVLAPLGDRWVVVALSQAPAS